MKILVIRTDNIGDLVCTTPIFTALRKHYPDAFIAAFVNSYNAPVLENNTDVDFIYIYTKGSHAKNIFYAYWKKILLISRLRKENFDYIILASTKMRAGTIKLARLLNAKNIIGYVDLKNPLSKYINKPVLYSKLEAGHEVEDTFKLLQQLNIFEVPPLLKVFPKPALVTKMKEKFSCLQNVMPIGLHISARQIKKQWPEDSFIALIKSLWSRYQVPLLLFWSPGVESNPMHPGDDKKATTILEACRDIPIFPCETHTLSELIAALSLTQAVICSDGGAMHIAAALRRPMVCFFESGKAKQWHPWGTEYALLQTEGVGVSDISVSEVLTAYEKLHKSF